MGPCRQSWRAIMRTNTAIVFAWAVFLAAAATGCSTIGNGESREIGGDVPKSITYDLKGRSLDCEISSDGDLQVELTVGENTHSVQSISGGTLNLTYKDGSITTVTSSSPRSSRGGTSSSTQVTSSAGTSIQESNSKTNKPAKIRQESRNVRDFEEVELRGVGNLSIEQTGSESLTVEAEEDVIPKVTTKVVNDRLIIGSEFNTIHTTVPITYRLTVKDLSALEVLGSANVEAESIKTDSLAVTISGAGNVRMDGKSDE